MDLRSVFLGVLFAIVWASAFTATRIIVVEVPPLLALVLRFLISGAIGVALAYVLGQRIAFTRGQWMAIIVFGLCQNALYLGLNWTAMQWVEASLATIIGSAMPLFVALAGWLFYGERLGLQGNAGIVAGIAGVGLIMGARLSGGADPFGVACCVIAVIALAVATLAMKGTGTGGGNLLMIVGVQMLVGAAFLIPPAVALETWNVTWTPRLFWAFAYGIFFPGLLATLVWFQLVRRIGATRAAVYHFLTPPFGVGLAALILGEKLGWTDVLGVIVVAAGILAVQLSKAESNAPRI